MSRQQAIERAQRNIQASRQRRELERWKEHHRRLAAVPVRSEDERLLQELALELWERERPA